MSKFPESFLSNIQKTLGSELEIFLESLEESAPVSIRLHPQKRAGLFEAERKIPWCKEGRYLSTRPLFTLDPLFHAGCYYVQEAGSMLIEKLTAEIIPELDHSRVLDLCASPGGKSTHLLNLLPKNSILVCNEVIPARNNNLRHNLSKWGYANTLVLQNETRQIAASKEKFDFILADVPCSGEGLFRKDPSSVKEWSLQQVEKCAVRQRDILNDLIPLLNEGGYLLYSTCTYEPAENDEQVEYLLQHFSFRNITPEAPQGITRTKHGWQAYPHKTESEGFYCCLLQYEGKLPNKEKSKHPPKVIPAFKPEDWLLHPENFHFFQQDEYVNAMSPELYTLLMNLTKTCYIRQAGIPMGRMKGKSFIPSTELCMSLEFKNTLPSIELNKKEAIDYLRCDSIHAKSAEQGIHLVKYLSFPIGWAKSIQHRWNNYYPKEWRIHMENEK